MNPVARTELLLGAEGLARLAASRVAVFGLGGVGGYVAEALCRSGVGALDLIDGDTVGETNLNRQVIATRQTIGQYKADAMAERLLSINPELRARPVRLFYLPENADSVDLSQYDYVVDAVDTVAAKLEIASRATALGVPVISAMGAGNKLDPSRLRIADIFDTSVCPLARVMRRELRRRGVQRLKGAYSTEDPVRPMAEGDAPEEPQAAAEAPDRPTARRDTPGSMIFVPAAMGMLIASEVIRELVSAEGPRG